MLTNAALAGFLLVVIQLGTSDVEGRYCPLCMVFCVPCPDGSQPQQIPCTCRCEPCPPVTIKPPFPCTTNLCKIGCGCPEGKIPDPNAVRPPNNCCWCPHAFLKNVFKPQFFRGSAIECDVKGLEVV